ncbi:MAG: PAS domain S-box protein [Magnetovibrio sp.]|nr:PAS domain S-box protein [Magnetovibrio sp.]
MVNRHSIIWKLVLPVPIMTLVAVVVSAAFIPDLIRKNVEHNAARSAIEMLNQYRALRSYYTEKVVEKVTRQGNLSATFDHDKNSGAIPLPVTMIHDLNKKLEGQATSLNLYSIYPFPNRRDRQLDAFQRQSWKTLENDPKHQVVDSQIRQGRTVLRVAIADLMQVQACIDCHNNHPLTPKSDWKLGDLRGVLEVSVDISTPLQQGRQLSRGIIFGIVLGGTLLVVFSTFLIHHTVMPVRLVTEDMLKLSTGDFNIQTRPDGDSDEFDQLVRALSNFKDHLIIKQDLEEAEKRRLNKEIQKRSTAFQDSENLSKRIFSSAQDGIIIINEDSTIINFNPAAEKIFGYQKSEIVGHFFFETIIHNQNKEAHMQGFERFLQNGEGAFLDNLIEITAFHQDGHEFPIELTITELKMGRHRGFAGFVRDISSRKKAEKMAAEATQKSETASRVKSEFLASMSHELRTPLNAIIGFSGVMKEQIYGPLGDAKYSEYVLDIQVSGQHLLKLINDILDVSAIEAGKVELNEEEVSIAKVAEASHNLIKSRAQDGALILNLNITDGLPNIWADERRIKQILLNLLSNAVKFTPQGGEISVTSWLNDDGSLAICVADTGIGMDEGDVEKALSEFGQVDSGLDRKHEGTGLGLPLSVGLMECHGGTLTITSAKEHGTQITLTFPKERIVHN